MIKLALRHIDRIVIVVGLLGLMVLTVRTLHNVALLAAEVTVQQEVRRDYGDIIVLYTLNAGNNKPARIAMMAMTTKSSINVKARPVSSEAGLAKGLVAMCSGLGAAHIGSA